MSTGPSKNNDTVGSLLKDIADYLTSSLRALRFADKRHWGPDEFEQIRALEDALDDAKVDFQELGVLVNGQFYYEGDRTSESLNELRALLIKYEFHARNFQDWIRQGGPINPIWLNETKELQLELHRTQCRAARRIFAAEQEGAWNRCLGAYQVYRQQRRNEEAERVRKQREEEKREKETKEGPGVRQQQRDRELERIPPWQRHEFQQQQQQQQGKGPTDEGLRPALRRGRRLSLEDLVPCCNAVGRFERFGEHDVAFVCDFCDGFIVWPDLQRMPSTRAPLDQTNGGGSTNTTTSIPTSTTAATNSPKKLILPTIVTQSYPSVLPQHSTTTTKETEPETARIETTYPRWQAHGLSAKTGEAKTVVFAPIAIGNHIAPVPGDWLARIWCPYCDEYTYVDQGEDSEDEVKWAQDERGFEDLASFQEHLEWYHTALPVPSIPALLPKAAGSCAVM
ncbi:hypothetical protein SMACR_06624 [Sordaria macrospora]|uniref:WGS project CABT00000000 data, contig 2.37 n=2 Tax=Sordaria macrospora TaxID=5147 RepID=F7W745_SORMK|nr:uncharacterized protein SMAC_06624 [Sordaria macrospora k-hell]KAA8630430.1 hypothetical protein SMACR_06624 [Sordaria macrospora]KAH7633531.1 hypothetical protein B0T09DRAFT_93675 [Sordaria sp. MPI-SDFR-AT-0083]WPJ60073.1 hypothetical protein SMAC4_06624 [Sordaria macrospora]CCC13335.1 unnamed protein product [Sordaria macrospora k-hell]